MEPIAGDVLRLLRCFDRMGFRGIGDSLAARVKRQSEVGEVGDVVKCREQSVQVG